MTSSQHSSRKEHHMATQAIVGAKTEQAHERALQVVREHAPEHAEALDPYPPGCSGDLWSLSCPA